MHRGLWELKSAFLALTKKQQALSQDCFTLNLLNGSKNIGIVHTWCRNTGAWTPTQNGVAS